MLNDVPSRRDFLWQAAGAGIAASAMAAAAHAQGVPPPPAEAGIVGRLACTLLPQQNRWRSLVDLSGLWEFQTDPAGQGESEGWFNGLPAPRLIAVPGSWNEQFLELRDYFDAAWYVTRTTLPAAWRGQRVMIRVGSAVYGAKLWIGGRPIGSHDGGNLPFAFEVTGAVAWDRPVTIAIRVENRLLPQPSPPCSPMPGRSTPPGPTASSPCGIPIHPGGRSAISTC